MKRRNIYFPYASMDVILAQRKDSGLLYLPAGDRKKVDYTCTDNNIAVIDNEGFVLGKREGKTSIIAIMNNSKIAVCDVNVKKEIIFVEDATEDATGFGTIYSSIICGNKVGFAPKAELYTIKVSEETGSITWKNAEKAINWCINNKMDIINLGFLNPSLYDKYLKLCYKNNIICTGYGLLKAEFLNK